MENNFIEIELSPIKLFDLHITGLGLKRKWIASHLDISSTYMSNIFTGRNKLTEKMRQKMNELLETNY